MNEINTTTSQFFGLLLCVLKMKEKGKMMLKKKNKCKAGICGILICGILSSGIFISCEKVVERKEMWLPQTESEDEILLYRHWDMRFESYDTNKKQEIQVNEGGQFFQYEFSNSTKYYTIGDTEKGGYQVVAKNGQKVETVYKMKNDQDAIFPLAADDINQTYLFLIYRGKDGKKREIVSMNEDGNMECLEKTEQKIMSGALHENTLYYSVYDEKKSKYDIYAMDITKTEKNPELIKSNVENDELFYFDGELFYQGEKTIFSETRSFENASDNHFLEKYKKLVQIDVDEEGNLMLTVIDTDTDQVIKKIQNPIDYQIKNDKMTVYCEGDIVEVGLKDFQKE